MSKRRKLAIVCAMLGILWLLTGGCVVFEAKYRFVDDYNRNYRPWLQVRTNNKHQTYGIPFVFTYIKSPPPFDAEFTYYTQDIVQGAELMLDRILVRYADGSEVDLADRVPKKMTMELFDMSYIEDHVKKKNKCLRATWKITNCITRDEKYTFVIAGRLQKENQVLEPFDVSLKSSGFVHTSFYSTWLWWFKSMA